MKVFLLNPIPALENIERQVRKLRAAGAAVVTFPIFGGEFRRAVAQIQKMKPAQRKKYHLDGDSFWIKAAPKVSVEIIPARGPFFWRAGVWVHHSIAWEIRRDGKPVHVMRDLEPYMPVAADVDGKVKPIQGRRQHREFLKRNKLVELGNEMPKDRRTWDMPNVREDLQRVMETGPTREALEASRRAKDAIKE